MSDYTKQLLELLEKLEANQASPYLIKSIKAAITYEEAHPNGEAYATFIEEQ